MKTVAGLFVNSADARSAADDLAAAGWTHENISIVASAQQGAGEHHPNLVVKDAEKGALVGGLAGLFLGLTELAVPGVGLVLVGGWLAAALLGAAAGAATGGIAGALVEAGMSHAAASHFAAGVQRGEILVTVKSEDARSDEAKAILQQNHAIRIESDSA
jgi:hypothetical protein